MSDSPERIWAQCSAHQNWDDLNASRYKIDWWHEYRRADLPPTLSAARGLPEVKQLMEAMERAIEAIDAAYDGPDDNGAYSVRERAALAAIKETKP